MENIIKEYHEFNTFGIEEDLVSQEDKEKLRLLRHRRKVLGKFNKDIFVLQTYDVKRQVEIFNGLKKRQGKDCHIRFINASGKETYIYKTSLCRGKVLLECGFKGTSTHFGMWLSTFLEEYKNGNIVNVRPEGFAQCYLQTVKESQDKTIAEIKNLKDKYNAIYKDRAKELQEQYEAKISTYPKLDRVARKREICTEDAIAKICKSTDIKRIKDYWNTQMTEDERKKLIEWISKNIYSIRVYGVIDGRSGNALVHEYSDIGGVKLREVKRNEENEIVSNDSITAHISFKDVSEAPREILEKVTSPKRKTKGDIFYNNRLNDKNLALFLLIEYKDKGFKAGVRNLYKQIKA